jgi:DNA-binding SARP family transcriptional activator
MKPRIAIRLFGKLSVHCGDRELLLHTSSKAREILAYLALNPRAPVLRESLANLISEESSTERSRKALRQALWQLHEGLACRAVGARSPLLEVDKRWAQLARGEHVWVDVDEFERAARASGGSDAGLSKDAKALQCSVELYRGELLQGWNQQWCVAERERLKQIYLEAVDKLLTLFEADRNVEAGVAYATLALRADPARECTHRSLMRLYCLAGDRASALHQYERCCLALRQELGIEPDDETKELEQQVRAGNPLVSPGKPTSVSLATGRYGGRNPSPSLRGRAGR